MSDRLSDLIAGVLNVPAADLTPDSGPGTRPEWDSLAHVTLVAAVEQTYGIELTMPEMLAIRSIHDLQETLLKHGVQA